MKAVSGKRFCRVLETNGWELKRINGSHHIYAKTGNTVRVSVPVHGHVPLKTGLLRHMIPNFWTKATCSPYKSSFFTNKPSALLRSLFPLFWMATAMDNGNDDDSVFFNSKVDSEWKSINYGTAGVPVNDRTDLRIF